MAKYRRLIKRRHTTSINITALIAQGEDAPLNRASRRLLAHTDKHEHMLRLKPDNDKRGRPQKTEHDEQR